MRQLGDIKTGDILYGYSLDSINVIEMIILSINFNTKNDIIVGFRFKEEANIKRESNIFECDLNSYYSYNNFVGGYCITLNFEIVEKEMVGMIKRYQEKWEDIKKMKPRKLKIKSILEKIRN